MTRARLAAAPRGPAARGYTAVLGSTVLTLSATFSASFSAIFSLTMSASEVTAGPLIMQPYAEPLFFDRRLELHPTASLGSGYDSNLDGHGTGDAFVHGTLGGDAHWYATPDLVAHLNLEAGRWTYVKTPNRDTDDLLADLEVFYVGPEWDVTSGAGGARGRVAEPITGEQVLRSRVGTDLGGERREPGLYLKAGIFAERIEYHEDTLLFSATQANKSRWGGALRSGWRLIDYTRIYLFSRGSWSSYDDEGRFRNGVLAAYGAGCGFALTPSVAATAELGLATGHYSAPTFADPAYDDRFVKSPLVDLGLRWDWEPGSQLTLGADCGLADGRTANAVRRYGLGLLGEVRLREQVRAFGEADWHREQDSGAAANAELPVRDITTATAGVRGTLIPGVGLQVSTGWARTVDNVGAGYDRVLIEATIGLAF